jgi:hypothetical protein
MAVSSSSNPRSVFKNSLMRFQVVVGLVAIGNAAGHRLDHDRARAPAAPSPER